MLVARETQAPNPRPDLSGVDREECERYVRTIEWILGLGADGFTQAEIRAELCELDLHLQQDLAIYVAVFDRLAQLQIITKAEYRARLHP